MIPAANTVSYISAFSAFGVVNLKTIYYPVSAPVWSPTNGDDGKAHSLTNKTVIKCESFRHRCSRHHCREMYQKR